MNKIEGTINYTLTLEENNVWKLNYNQTINNDIASIAISEHVLAILNDKLKIDKREAKGKEISFLSQRIEKITQAKFGLSLMFDYCIKLYDVYTKGMEAKADEAAKKAAKSLGENNALDVLGNIGGVNTVESPPTTGLTIDQHEPEIKEDAKRFSSELIEMAKNGKLMKFNPNGVERPPNATEENVTNLSENKD